MLYYLMIKEIEQTGMRYLCKRKQNLKDPNDHIRYKGSGVYWRRVLQKHPEYTIKTTVLGLYSAEDLREIGLFYSKLFNIVESREWANLVDETGAGGDTSKTDGFILSLATKRTGQTKGYRTIHNPLTEEVKRLAPGQDILDGFVYGGPTGRGYGPTGKKVYHNGHTKIYVNANETPPEGLIKGVYYEGTTKGRLGYHNPITLEKRYLKVDETPPEGFVKGIPPTTGKSIRTPYGLFPSIQKCIEETSLSRYAIEKNLSSKEDWSYV